MSLPDPIEAAPDIPPRALLELPIDQIAPDMQQPRRHFDQEALQLLADDIRVRGILQPIAVLPTGENHYTICYGERRWRAAQLAGLQTIPCLIDRPIPEKIAEDGGISRAFDQIAENVHRQNLNAIELGTFFKRLRDLHDVPVGQIPELCAQNGLPISRSYVSNLIRLTELPQWAQDLIQAGTLTAGHGKILCMARDLPEVMQDLQDELTDPDLDPDDLPTVKELQASIYGACQRHYNIVHDWVLLEDAFDERRESLQTISLPSPWNSERVVTFARNVEAYHELLEQLHGKNEPQSGQQHDNGEDLDQDPVATEPGNPWPGFDEYRQLRTLKQHLREYLIERLMAILEPRQLLTLTFWLALDGPEFDDEDPDVGDCTKGYVDVGCEIMQGLKQRRPGQLIAKFSTEADLQILLQDHLPAILCEVETGTIIRLAQDLGIGIDDWYINREILETLSLEQFNQMIVAGDSLAQCPEAWPREQRLAWAEENAQVLPPPDVLLQLWDKEGEIAR